MQSHIINWVNIHLKGDLWAQHHRLRYQSFVDRQGWNVPNHIQMEWDQYDNPRATYILIEENGQCLACCRLVSSTHPYMIEEIFPDLLPYAPPKVNHIWEASRIAVAQHIPANQRQTALQGLIIAIQQFGLDNGIDKYLGLMPMAIFKRTLIRNGVRVDIHKDHAKDIDGKLTAIADIYVDQVTIDFLRNKVAA